MDTVNLEQQMLIAAAAVVAASLLVVVILRLSRHRTTQVIQPRAVSTSPYLETADGRLQLPLTELTQSGMVIGRSPAADLRVDASVPEANTVSERHARIYQDASTGCVMIEDLDSTNGVFINGRRAPHKNMLRDRWTVGLGSLKFIYRDGHSDTGPME